MALTTPKIAAGWGTAKASRLLPHRAGLQLQPSPSWINLKTRNRRASPVPGSLAQALLAPWRSWQATLSSAGPSQVARGAPRRSRSPGLAHRGAGALPLSAAACPLRFQPPRLPRGKTTRRSGRASPSAPRFRKAARRAPAAACPPAELGWALHASSASATSLPGGAPWEVTLLGHPAAAAGLLHAAWEHSDWSASPCPTPSLRSRLLPLLFSSPTPPARACVCSTLARGPGEQSGLGARRSYDCSRGWGGGSGEVAAWRRPRTSQVGAEPPLTDPPVRRRRERGTSKLLLGASSPPPVGPCPWRKWSVALAYHYSLGLLRGARIQRLPAGALRGRRVCVWLPLALRCRRWGKVCGRQRPAADWDWDTCCKCSCYLPWPCSAPAAPGRPLKVRGSARLRGHLPPLLPSLLLPRLPSSSGFLKPPQLEITFHSTFPTSQEALVILIFRLCSQWGRRGRGRTGCAHASVPGRVGAVRVCCTFPPTHTRWGVLHTRRFAESLGGGVSMACRRRAGAHGVPALCHVWGRAIFGESLSTSGAEGRSAKAVPTP